MQKKNLLAACIGIAVFIMACQFTGIKSTPVSKTGQTSTALPSSVPLPTIEEFPTPTIVIALPFFDDFSTDAYGWPTGLVPGDYADTTYEIASGVYKWTVLAHKNAYSIAWPDLPAISNFTLTMDAQQTSGAPNDSDYGFIYRTMDGQKYFSFALCNDQFSVYFYDKTAGWQEVIPWSFSNAILPGQIKHLKLVAANGSYAFYTNDALLTQFSDDRVPEGRPGLGVDVYTTGATAVYEFDNFAVTPP